MYACSLGLTEGAAAWAFWIASHAGATRCAGICQPKLSSSTWFSWASGTSTLTPSVVEPGSNS
jgi:hypothetical protein